MTCEYGITRPNSDRKTLCPDGVCSFDPEEAREEAAKLAALIGGVVYLCRRGDDGGTCWRFCECFDGSK
jgi:hypothetical protein